MREPRPSQKRFPWLPPAILLTMVLYGLSFGPACWMLAGRQQQDSQFVHIVYAPVLWMGSYGPRQVRDYITSYANYRSYPYAVQIHKNRLYYRHWLVCPSHFE